MDKKIETIKEVYTEALEEAYEKLEGAVFTRNLSLIDISLDTVKAKQRVLDFLYAHFGDEEWIVHIVGEKYLLQK